MFNYHGKIENVTVAATQANSMLFNGLFYAELRGCKDFVHSNIDNFAVIDLINKHKMDDIAIEVYKPWYRWSKAIAYFSSDKPYTINLNYYRIRNMNKFSITGTLMHELVHLVDNKYHQYSFGHKTNNRNKYNNNKSAPYQCGSVAKRFATRLFS
jgi:Zn-dependent peptidase ImmA (M78 family)